MRKENWESELMLWVESAMLKQFVWGQFDCALMAASAVEATTGGHPRPDLIDAYFTPLGAYRVLKKEGGLTGICDNLFDRVDPELAQRGDLLLIKLEKDGRKRETLAVDLGANCLMAADRPRLVPKSAVDVHLAWGVE